MVEGAHRAAELVHDLARDGEAEAGACARRLGGEERIEHAAEVLGGNPRSGVADREHDPAIAAARFGLDAALALHRLCGVEEHVEHHLLELSRAREHRRARGAAIRDGHLGTLPAVPQ